MPKLMDATNVKLEDIERPPLLPVGHYVALVYKVPEIKDEHDEYQYIDVPLKFLSAHEDVNQQELQEFGGIANVIRTKRFIFNKNDEQGFKRSEYQAKRFITDHLKVEGAGQLSWPRQALEACVNHQCLVQVGRRTDKQDPDIIYEDIKKTAPVD